MMKRSALLLLLVCVPAWGQSKVKIALAGPMSGAAAAFGDTITKGARLAIAQANAQGKRQFELVLADDMGHPRRRQPLPVR